MPDSEQWSAKSVRPGLAGRSESSRLCINSRPPAASALVGDLANALAATGVTASEFVCERARAFVDALRELDAPPERMLVLLKTALKRSDWPHTAHDADRAHAHAAVVSQCIEHYYSGRSPSMNHTASDPKHRVMELD